MSYNVTICTPPVPAEDKEDNAALVSSVQFYFKVERLPGVQILADLDSKWTPRNLFRDAEAREHFRKSVFCQGFSLVDLDGFEPSTSSMPWKRAPNCATGPQIADFQYT